MIPGIRRCEWNEGFCPKPAAPDQKYCCLEHSPCGHLSGREIRIRRNFPLPPGRVNGVKMAKIIGVTDVCIGHWARSNRIPYDPDPNYGRVYDPEAVKAAIERTGGIKANRKRELKGAAA